MEHTMLNRLATCSVFGRLGLALQLLGNAARLRYHRTATILICGHPSYVGVK